MVESFLDHSTDTWTSPSVNTAQLILLPNASHGCRVMNWSQMEYMPWDNPDNIVSEEVEKIVWRIKVFALVILFLIGGPGNVINMVVFYKQGLKDRVNLCLFALSFADEIYLITAMLHYAEQFYLQFTTKEIVGPMLTFVTNNRFTGLLGTSYVSLVLSAIIASERCLCVLYPLKFQVMMHTRTMAVIIFNLYIALIGLYSIVAFRFQVGCVYNLISGTVTKAAVHGEFYTKHKQFIDNLDGSLFGVGIPTTSVVVVITTTVITVMKLRQIVTWRAGTTSSLSPREIALTKMLVGTSILFLACTIPRSTLRFSWLFLPEMNAGRRHHNFYFTSVWFIETNAYINSSLNIIVYYCMGSRYRETVKSLFVNKKQPVQQQKP